MTFRFARRVQIIPESAIHEMTRLSEQIDDVAFLSWAKPSSNTPEHINKAAIEAIKQGKTSAYSDTLGLYELREAITKKLANFNNIPAKPDEIIVTIGAVEALSAAIMTLVHPGDEVIIPTPCYSTHIHQVQLAHGIPVCVSTEIKNNFALDINKIKNAINRRTRLIILCNPNNPTGAVYSKEELQQLAELASEHNLYIIADEAYEYFTFDGYKHYSIAALSKRREKIISIFTFTKTYAMTGWRVGYVHAHQKIIKQLHKIHIPLAICAPVVSQYAALAALRGSQDCINKFCNFYKDNRDLMCERLDRLSEVFEYSKPRGAYLMLPKILLPNGKDSLSFAKKLLLKAHVSATPGIAFQAESHLRLSFCVTPEMINKAFDRLEKYFK